MRQIPEADWKVFRQLHPVALERFCAAVLAQAQQLAAPQNRSAHERYLELYRLLDQRNKSCADLFDDFRRSTALLQLVAIKRDGWITDEEMLRFSQETQDFVTTLLSND